MLKKMYNTHCIVHLIHRYSPCGCRSVQTHGYTFLDLHKQTDCLHKLLDDQKNQTNRDQSWPIVDTNYISLHYHFDCEGCVTSHARAVSIENLVIWKGSSQLTFKDFFCFALYIYIFFFFVIDTVQLHFIRDHVC